jgi:hypothetical protein
MDNSEKVNGERIKEKEVSLKNPLPINLSPFPCYSHKIAAARSGIIISWCPVRE